MIFGEDDEDGEPFASPTLPQVGPVILWQLPGLDILGMKEESTLSIEVLPRPAKDVSPVEERLVWYWDPESQDVSVAPASFSLLATGMRSTTIPPIASSAAPPPFLLADPIAGQQGFHNHGLISYALDNDPLPPAGAYGFFARLLSDQHAASEPFLLVFNHGVEPAQMPIGAQAINAAAFLPGDYNHDDQVDAADYIMWRHLLGSTTELSADGSGNGLVDEADYEVWRAHFGIKFGEPRRATTRSLASVPEPSPATSVAVGMLAALAAPLRRRATNSKSN
jgi:hypothetical protein